LKFSSNDNKQDRFNYLAVNSTGKRLYAASNCIFYADTNNKNEFKKIYKNEND
jgi:hypothetical protein